MDLLRSCLSDVYGKLSDAAVLEDRRVAAVEVRSVPPTEFAAQWRQKAKTDQLTIEFKALLLHQGTQRCAEAACLPVNRHKNCPGNVLPYEHNRVLLEPNGFDPHSDYINASWIDGWDRSNVYIATQGPTLRTVADFWRMVWQYNVSCIVMTTNLFEHARQQCEKYWHHLHGRYGSIDVWLESTFSTAEYTIRNFRTSCSGYTRRVRQLQFQSWSESEPPQLGTVIEIRRKMKEWLAQRSGPIVVHCSNGGGRTGTFLAIDIALNQYEAGADINIFQTALKLRRMRTHQIATPDQYHFVHRVVANFIVSGYTVMKAADICDYLQKLKEKKEKLTGFEEELKNINSFVSPLCVGECAGGHRAENRWKSRDIMVQPPERARPYLITHENADSTDYINAVYIDGYRTVNQFIVTQWPYRNTVNDVWRLVHDHNISVIVILNDSKHSRSYPSFWPLVKDKEVAFGPVTLEIVEDRELSDRVRCRQIRLRKVFAHERHHKAMHVCLLQLRCWPNKLKVPENSAGIQELIQLTEEWTAKMSATGPVLVMSRDGVSRCGPFCVAFVCLERLRSEGEVDVYRAVSAVKRNRPQLVDSLAEYIFCYFTVETLVAEMQKGRLQGPPSTNGAADEDNQCLQRSFTLDCLRQQMPKSSARLPDLCSDDPMFQIARSDSSSPANSQRPRRTVLLDQGVEEEEEEFEDDFEDTAEEDDEDDVDEEEERERGAMGMSHSSLKFTHRYLPMLDYV